jgi:hypothetical protein
MQRDGFYAACHEVFWRKGTFMNISKIIVGSVALTCLAASNFALAQKSKSDEAAKTAAAFKHHDKNKDGGLSREEADKKVFPAIAANFDAMDTNKDGKVTLEERNAWVEKQKADNKKGERKGQK